VKAAAIVVGILSGLALALRSLSPPEPVSTVRFVDVAARAGITFRHDNAASSEKYLIETMGAGAAWIDYDGDGFLDLYLVNSAATQAYRPARPLRSALYRNNGDGTFTDVTVQAGIAAEGLFGMGVAVGDYDNDGLADLYVTGYGKGILYHNEGNGRFADVTAKAGVANTGKWGSSAAWCDYDRDGRLDLVIANYVDWSVENNLYCGERRPGYRAYCHPNKFRGQTPTLFRNQGNGSFKDVSAASGVASKPGNGLGVVCFDYDQDGWTDIFFANDGMENFLYRNRGNGTFEEIGAVAGVAWGENGEIEAGMGVDVGDYNRDGWPDLFITHLDLELNRLYRHHGKAGYEDATFRDGPGYQTFHLSGFGVGFVDLDNDGWLDLFIANGHILDNIHLYHPNTTYAEPKFVYRNMGGKFVNFTALLGDDLARPRVSRAAAFADYDNDGDLDVAVNNNGQEAELLRNDGGNANHWLQLYLIGTRSNRDAVGARVVLWADGQRWVAEKAGGRSYQAAHDPRLHFGLGKREMVERVEVFWPSGVRDVMESVRANQLIAVREGAGRIPVAVPKLRPSSDKAGGRP
jgi:hypothetical protein